MNDDMNKKLLRILLSAVLLLAVWLLTREGSVNYWYKLVLYGVPYLIVGYDVLLEAWEGICDRDPFNEDFLMSVATLGALAIGEFPEAVFVMLFFQVGELFEDYAEDRSRRSIDEMMDLRPDTANIEIGGELKAVTPAEVKVGSLIVVRPGEKVPLDGTIVDGQSSLNTVALTGESLPRTVSKGDDVISGCVNIDGLLKVRTTKTFGESTASKIIQLVEDSQENKSRSENFITRFAHVYTPIVVFAAIALAVLPPLLGFGAWSDWLYRALTFLVVSCPCALVISVPLTFFGGIGGASRNGILIKGGNYMDALAKAGTVVFDKTGTLTRGVFKVTSVHPDHIAEKELLHLAAHVERFSTHPIAAALREAYPAESDSCEVGDVYELSGHGVQAKVNGRDVCVGNEKMMATLGIEVHECPLCKEHVGTVVHVAIDGQYAGHIVIADEVKADSSAAIASLKQLGVSRTVMLTGDRKEVGEQVARQLGLDEWHAGLLPADKVAQVERLLQDKPADKTLAFVGDGINDAPVLARADVGIAMGAMGSDAAIEAADVVLMDDKPSKIGKAIEISRRTIRIARENAWFAIGVKVAILGLAASGVLGSLAMAFAVFGDVGVMVLAVLNATRAMKR